MLVPLLVLGLVVVDRTYTYRGSESLSYTVDIIDGNLVLSDIVNHVVFE